MSQVHYVKDGTSLTHKKGIINEGTEVQNLFDNDALKELVKRNLVTTDKPQCVQVIEAKAKAIADAAKARGEKKPAPEVVDNKGK